MRQRVIATVFSVLVLLAVGPVLAGDALAVGVPFENIGEVIDAGAVNVLYSNAAGLSGEGDQFWHQDSGGIAGLAEESDSFGRTLVSGDFNGDGAGDLAIGVAYEKVGEADAAGMVNVLYADAAGRLAADGNQRWHEGWDGLPGTPEAYDRFGDALAAGDFNGDGFDDLAIGVPGKNLGASGAGCVWVLFGSTAGLTSSHQEYWSQGHPDVTGAIQTGDLFGGCLAAGDFDGDGFDDLAIAVTGEEVNGLDQAGAVNVLYGASFGLMAGSNNLWTDPWVVYEGARFGKALATGDLDGDGRDELAIGAPNMPFAYEDEAGTVTVLRGTAGGLSSSGSQSIAQGASIPGGYVADQSEQNDRFGSVLAIGDFDGDGYEDLAVGVPDEDLVSKDDAGAVHVLFGSAAGITATGNQLWHQDLDNVWGTAEEYDEFGFSLAAGDFNGGRFCDLAVGVPFESYGVPDAPGVVTVFRGSTVGIESGLRMWSQGQAGVLGGFEDYDYFGYELVVINTGLFRDGFESGDVSVWSVVVP